MLTYSLIYLAGGLGAVVLLSLMILRIGALMSACPEGAPFARPAAVTIATGFAAIGTGLVLLVGALLPLFPEALDAALPLALGFASLCLGLGFTQAASTLRDVTSGKPESRAAVLRHSAENAPLEPSS